jgi:hypothetical protein
MSASFLFASFTLTIFSLFPSLFNGARKFCQITDMHIDELQVISDAKINDAMHRFIVPEFVTFWLMLHG